MKYSGHRKLLCELSKLSKLNAFILLGYQTNIDASILVYKFRPERTGFIMYAEHTQPQLTFLALLPCSKLSLIFVSYESTKSKFKIKNFMFYFVTNRFEFYDVLVNGADALNNANSDFLDPISLHPNVEEIFQTLNSVQSSNLI